MNRKKLIAFIVCVLVFLVAASANANDLRIAGEDRFETAVEVSKKGWSSSNTVVIATAFNFPDALAGTPLAHKHNAPILLVSPDNMPTSTKDEIQRLGASNAYILGGPVAISDRVESEIRSMGLSVTRIAGEDRHETSVKIAQEVGLSNTAIVVNGYSFHEAMSIAPHAARNGIPILLTLTNRLPSEVDNILNGSIQTIVIEGNERLSSSVVNQLPNVTRITASNAYDIPVQLNRVLGLNYSTSYIATGEEFADALTGSVLASKDSGQIVFVRQNSIPSNVRSLLNTVNNPFVLGGPVAISDSVVNSITERTELTPQQIYNINNEKVVYVETNRGQGQGSGVIVGDGLVLTNEHVTNGMTEGHVLLSNGSYFEIAGVVEEDGNKDLALIKLREIPNVSPVVFGNSSNSVVGDNVAAIGSPKGYQNTLSTGIISSFRTQNGVREIQNNASITYGSSGGGLFDKYGELIGITTSGHHEGNLYFAVDVVEFNPWSHYLSMNHSDIPVEDLPEPRDTLIRMGMTKDEVKYAQSHYVSRLVNETATSLTYADAYYFDLNAEIYYTFENGRLVDYIFFIQGIENFSLEQLEALFHYMVDRNEAFYGRANHIDRSWRLSDGRYRLSALWENNVNLPSNIYIEVSVDGTNFTVRAVALYAD